MPVFEQTNFKAAFFDFDDTLTHGDTLPLWLVALRGWPWTIAAYLIAGTIGGFIPAKGAFDRRGRIKTALLQLTVRGITAERAAAAGAKVKRKIRWQDDIVARLRDHHANGDKVIVVSGAATIYLPMLLEDLPVDEILGTKLEIAGGRLTGRIDGMNCVRTAKRDIVQSWLDRYKPDETWGYGNDPHDLPMLALLDHRTIV